MEQGRLFDDDPTEKLKNFMEDHFDFGTFKECGLYPKELKRSDYEGQAKIICNRLGLESIYHYGIHDEPIRCHISYASHVYNVDIGAPPFVEVIHPLRFEVGGKIPLGKIVPFKK